MVQRNVGSDIQYQAQMKLSVKYVMKHSKVNLNTINTKKEKHPSFVTRCNNALNGKCRYGVEFCWFNHKEDEEHEIVTNNYEVQTNEKNEELERLFDIVEKNSERLKELEKRC